MMRKLLRKLPAILLLLLLYSMGCTPTQVPVLLPVAPCPLPDLPSFPDPKAEACGDKVCITPEAAEQIFTWVKASMRRQVMAQACIDDRTETPKALESAKGPTMKDAVADIVAKLSFHGIVHVNIVWRACGEMNAFYTPGQDLVVCDELAIIAPDFVPFAVAHEMSHAVIHQLRLPFTGSEEAAADELATVFLLITGHVDQVQAAITKFGFDATDMFWDDHLSNARRAYNAVCLARGSLEVPGWGECFERWERATDTWFRLINAGLVSRG